MADFQFYFLPFLIGAISIILIKAFHKSTRSTSRLPPSPFALPIIGHLHLLGPLPHQVLHNLSTKYGPVFQIYLGSVPCVVANSSETAKQLFKTHDTKFLDRPHNSCMDYIAYGGNGFIFAPYGPYWKFLKKIVMSELLNVKTVDSLVQVRHDEINRFIRFLSQNAKSRKPVELEVNLMKMTNNVISRMLMSKRCSDEDNEAGDIRKIVTDISEVMGIFNVSDHIWFLKNLDLQGVRKRAKGISVRFDKLIEKCIREHEEARKGNEAEKVKDLMNILLDIAENDSMEIKLTREHIKAFVLVILTGHFYINYLYRFKEKEKDYYEFGGKIQFFQLDIKKFDLLHEIQKKKG